MIALVEHLKAHPTPLYIGGASLDAFAAVRADLAERGAEFYAFGVCLDRDDGAWLIVADRPFHSPDPGGEAFTRTMLEGKSDGEAAELSGRDAAGQLLAGIGSELVGPIAFSPAWAALASASH